MPRPDKSQLSPSGRHLATEYARARAQGVSQKEFASSVGMSPRYVRKILSGERSGSILEKRAQGGVLNVPVVYHDVQSTQQVRLPQEMSRWDIYRPRTKRAIRRAVAEQRREHVAPPINKVIDTNTARQRGRLNLKRIRPAKRVRYNVIPISLWRDTGRDFKFDES